jgi:hypothetical protein
MITIIIPIGEGQRNYAKEGFEKIGIYAIEIKGSLHEKGNDKGKCENLERAKAFVFYEYVLLCDSDVLIQDDAQDLLDRCERVLENRPEIDGVAVDTKECTEFYLKSFEKQGHINCAFILMRSAKFKETNFTFTGMCACMNFNRGNRLIYIDYTTHLSEVER